MWQLSPGHNLPRWLGLFHCGGLGELLDIAPMPKIPPVVRYTLDALLIAVPLILMTYFLFDLAAFNAFTAWRARVL
jgi:hypothetical protein